MTWSQLMPRHARVARLAHLAQAGLAAAAQSRSMASATRLGSGAPTSPVSPSVTNSSGPPASLVVSTGLRERNASTVT